ncbi:MAG: hypothetical protein ACP5OB_02900 [Candidatus Ratteibacteria bacterium]
MEKKKLVRLGFLILVLIIAWIFALKPKKIVVKNIEKKETYNESFGDIDLRKIEEDFESTKKKLNEIEGIENLKIKKVYVLKDPLKVYLPEKKKEEKIIEEKKEPKKPDFYISGIVYDEKIPYVIINDEVKKEGEKIGDFIIQKIYNDRIIVKDNDKNIFVLNFNYEKGEKK